MKEMIDAALVNGGVGKALDLGCGDGTTTLYLANKGVETVGVDSSPQMLDLCKQRIGSADVALHQLDIAELHQLKVGNFDFVVSSLALHYVEDWDKVFSDVASIVVNGGRFLFSCAHPFADLIHNDVKNYFEVEKITEYWKSFDEHVTTFRRPLQDIYILAKKHGFVITNLVEAMPNENIKSIDEETYTELLKEPNFIYFELMKNE